MGEGVRDCLTVLFEEIPRFSSFSHAKTHWPVTSFFGVRLSLVRRAIACLARAKSVDSHFNFTFHPRIHTLLCAVRRDRCHYPSQPTIFGSASPIAVSPLLRTRINRVHPWMSNRSTCSQTRSSRLLRLSTHWVCWPSNSNSIPRSPFSGAPRDPSLSPLGARLMM